MCKKYIFRTRFQSQKDVPLCAVNTIPLFQKEINMTSIKIDELSM
jgi:hypothetical protein